MLPKKLLKSWKLSDADKFIVSNLRDIATTYGDIKFFGVNDDSLFLVDKIGNIYFVIPGCYSQELYQSLWDNDPETFIKSIQKNWETILKCNEFCGFIRDGFFFLDGDTEDKHWETYDGVTPLVDVAYASESITFSFQCIAELDPKGLEKLQDQKINIIDYTEKSKVKELTPKQTKTYESGKYVTPPAKGFTVIKQNGRYVWHQSESILLYDSSVKKSYLLGQDEGQYFGVELPRNPKTIGDAFESLKPKALLEHEASMKKRKLNIEQFVKRQGEWFFVSLQLLDIPKEEDCTLILTDSGNSYLPHDPSGNKHEVQFSQCRIHNNEVYFYDIEVAHDQHDTLFVSGWSKVFKNTAVRSVSVDGVD